MCITSLLLSLLCTGPLAHSFNISGDEFDESYASMGYGSDFEDFLDELDD